MPNVTHRKPNLLKHPSELEQRHGRECHQGNKRNGSDQTGDLPYRHRFPSLLWTALSGHAARDYATLP
jgi:hypothetical protein